MSDCFDHEMDAIDSLLNWEGDEPSGPLSPPRKKRLSPDKYEIVHQTEKAMLVKIKDKDVWLPKSQVSISEANKTMIIPMWLWRANF